MQLLAMHLVLRACAEKMLVSQPTHTPPARFASTLSSFVELLQTENWNFGLSPSDFILEDSQGSVRLTEANQGRLHEYAAMVPKPSVVDLGQNPSARPRMGYDTFPTLTRGCTKLMHIESGHIFSESLSRLFLCVWVGCPNWTGGLGHVSWMYCSGGLELAAAHGMPIDRALSNILGSRSLSTHDVSNSALCSMVTWLHVACTS